MSALSPQKTPPARTLLADTQEVLVIHVSHRDERGPSPRGPGQRASPCGFVFSPRDPARQTRLLGLSLAAEGGPEGLTQTATGWELPRVIALSFVLLTHQLLEKLQRFVLGQCEGCGPALWVHFRRAGPLCICLHSCFPGALWLPL